MPSHSELALQFISTSTKLNKRLDSALSYHGLGHSEFIILHHLISAPEQTLNRITLADKMGITASGVTRLLAPMEKNHLVSKLRNPKDARQSLVQLTQTGDQIYSESKVSFDNACADVFSFIEPEILSELYVQVMRMKV